MISSLGLLGCGIAVVLTIAATVVEATLRHRPVITRCAWAGAVIGTPVLMGTAVIQRFLGGAAIGGFGRDGGSGLASLPGAMESMLRAAESLVPSWFAWSFGTLWAASSALVAATFVISYRAWVEESRRGETVHVSGQRLLVCEDLGPLVVGFLHPEIVLPRRMLSLPSEKLQWVIAHERAHVAALDHQLLVVACGAVTLMPWNPMMWLMLSRLRLATERACDARVVSAGVSIESYAELLVDLVGWSLPVSASAIPGFAGRQSQLASRLVAMRDDTEDVHDGLHGTAGVVAFALLLGAMQPRLPFHLAQPATRPVLMESAQPVAGKGPAAVLAQTWPQLVSISGSSRSGVGAARLVRSADLAR